MTIWVEGLKMFLSGVTAGAGACLAFCLPVLLPLIAGTSMNSWQGLSHTLLFSAGRFVAYIILGFLAGWSIRLLNYLVATQSVLAAIRIAAGLWILLLGVLLTLGKDIRWPWCRQFYKYFIDKNHKSVFILGILIGFAPCLPLIGILTYIAVKAVNPLQGAVLGLCFGAGTIVSPLLAIGLFTGSISEIIITSDQRRIWLNKASGLFLILWGILLTFKK